MAPPPLEVNADALSRAIDDARAKGVERATVAKGEAKLREAQVRTAAHAHSSGLARECVQSRKPPRQHISPSSLPRPLTTRHAAHPPQSACASGSAQRA